MLLVIILIHTQIIFAIVIILRYFLDAVLTILSTYILRHTLHVIVIAQNLTPPLLTLRLQLWPPPYIWFT